MFFNYKNKKTFLVVLDNTNDNAIYYCFKNHIKCQTIIISLCFHVHDSLSTIDI